MQSDAFKSELKVRQKERVPSRFDTRLWLYGLHGRVQSEAFRLIWSSTKGLFGCDLEALDSVQNRVNLELQSNSEATVRLNSSLT